MGSESYYINLLPPGVTPVRRPSATDAVPFMNSYEGASNLPFDRFATQFTGLPLSIRKHHSDPHTLAVDDTFTLTISHEHNQLQEISVEGCLCWYPEGITTAFSIVRLIADRIIPVRAFYRPDTWIDLDSEAAFTRAIRGRFDQKWQHFQTLFGQHHTKMLPNEFLHFYTQPYRYRLNKLIQRVSGRPFYRWI